MNTQNQSRSRIPVMFLPLVLLLGLLICGLSVPLSQGKDAGTQNADMDAQFRSYVELLRSDLKSGKVVIYNRVMKMSDAESKIFWPLYQDYETELFSLGDRRLELIKKFADAYNRQTLDDATAKSLTKDWFGHQEGRLKLWKKYQKRMEKEMNATRAAQFLQIENRINALVDLMLASEIPLIDPAAGANALR